MWAIIERQTLAVSPLQKQTEGKGSLLLFLDVNLHAPEKQVDFLLLFVKRVVEWTFRFGKTKKTNRHD